MGKDGRLDPLRYAIVFKLHNITGCVLLPIKTKDAWKGRAKIKKDEHGLTWTPIGTRYPGDAGAVSQQHPFGPEPRLHFLPEE